MLALELMCRNIRHYIEANRVKGASASATTLQRSLVGYEQYAPLPMRTTRRMNAWQQTQEAENEDYWEQQRIGIRSTRTSRTSVDYTEY